jgi:RNA polymerase sigma-70 factor (ECF subfamily)
MPEPHAPSLTLVWSADPADAGNAAGARTGAVLPAGKTLATDPDEQLLERIARGDTTAVSVLVSRKLPKLLSLGRRMLGDAIEAEDVAQETLLRTWKQAAVWVPGKARIDTWMHRVALNLCYDRLRRRRDTSSADDIELADPAMSAPARIEADQTARQVRAAIEALPDRQREAIQLTYYQELSNQDAAGVMNVSVEALESLLARARRGLRSAMSGAENKDPSSTLGKRK